MPIQLNHQSLTDQEFIPEGQDEPKSSFTIKPPSEALKTKLMFLSQKDQLDEAVELVIQHCLTGWQNVYDDKDQAIDYAFDQKAFLPAALRMDIFTAACQMASLSDDEKKTSSSLST